MQLASELSQCIHVRLLDWQTTRETEQCKCELLKHAADLRISDTDSGDCRLVSFPWACSEDLVDLRQNDRCMYSGSYGTVCPDSREAARTARIFPVSVAQDRCANLVLAWSHHWCLGLRTLASAAAGSEACARGACIT